MVSSKHHYNDFVCITRRGSAFLTHHTVPFKFFISFYCGDTHTPNISREQCDALLDEQSHVDVFSNYLACCNSVLLHYRLEVIKKQGDGGGGGQIHGHYFFNLRPLLGLM